MEDTLTIICIALGILSFIEIIGQNLLVGYFYQIGFPIKNETVNANIEHNYEINKVIVKEEGKYKFISKSEIIFTSRWHFFSFFRFDSLIPVKNICKISFNKCEIISKLPLGTTIALGALIIGPFLIKLNLLPLDKNNFLSEMGYFASILFLIISLIMYLVELSRLKRRKAELFEILNINK